MERRVVLGLLAASTLLSTVRARADAAVESIIRVNIPGPHMLPYLPVELIPRLGIDQALGTRLSIRYLPSGVLALEDAVAGNGDFAGIGFSVLPNFITKNKPVAAVATLSSGVPPYSILIRTELAQRVRRIADLKGRSIGVPMGSITSKTYLQTVLEMWLSTHGIRATDVRWVHTNQNLDGMLGGLSSGVVDAVFCEEPLAGTLVRKKIGLRLANMADPNAPGRAPWARHLRAVLAAPREILEHHPRRAQLMVAMLQRSLRWVQASKPEDIVVKLGIQDPDLARDLSDPIRRIPNLFSRDGRFRPDEVAASQAFLAATGTVLPPGVTVQGLIDDRWVGR